MPSTLTRVHTTKHLLIGILPLYVLLSSIHLYSGKHAGAETTDREIGQNWHKVELSAKHTKFKSQLSSLDIPFITNEGQFDMDVKFYARTIGGTAFVTESGDIIYSLTNRLGEKSISGIDFKEHFVGHKQNKISGKDPSTTKVNLYRGRDRNEWRNGIPTFEMIDMGEVWDGIGLTLKAHNNNIEKIFTIAAGANPGDIRIGISGMRGLNVNDAGELEVLSLKGLISFTKPVAYQENPGWREYIEVAYAVDGNEYGFSIGDYDRETTLFIDPLLASTILGGWCDDICYGPFIETDVSGNVYLSGFTCTPTFPTSLGAYQRNYAGGQLDCFISKFNSDLTTLLASTFLGGSGFETECTIALDDSGNIYAGGFTNSQDFPTTPGAYNEDPNGNYDIFISKLDNDLTTLIASTYIGGSSNDGYESNRIDLVVGESGDLYFVAQSSSDDFPTTPGAYDSSYNGSGFIVSGDAVIARMDRNLTTLQASTYLGGSLDELRVSIALDENENVFVCTGTYSSDLSTPGTAYDRDYNGSGDVFIAKLSSDLTTLAASTYLGSGYEEIPHVIEIDGNGNAFISGYTQSSNFPTTPGVFDEVFNAGGEDGFISKFDNGLTTLLASTFLGGNDLDRSQALVIHESGDIYVTGKTMSEDFPIIPGTYDDDYNGGGSDEHGDIFVSKLDVDLTVLKASTFLGGSDDEKPFGIAFDGSGNVFVGGFTHSNDYPTSEGAYDRSFDGIRDVIVAKLHLEPDLGVEEYAGNENQAALPRTIRLSQNYPNPFNPSTTISFEIPALKEGESPEFIGSARKVKLTLYDTRGRHVRRLIDSGLNPGGHKVVWDGKDDKGESVPSGIYFCTLKMGEKVVRRKITLLK
jgi:hypothetical protein